MSTTNTNPDPLDHLFSDFFKAQLKQPWPKAPLAGGGRAAEPSELAAARASDTPCNEPAPVARGRDNTARARFTLAASVAIALGATWFLSNGSETGPRGGTPTKPGPGLFNKSDAKGTKGGVLDTINENKANGDAPKVDPNKFE
ncbi:MAG: hypothetical protein FJ304_23210 [Planctomycetes bacterium]|nr:hypothetical protein [Planctomycetota bacterium]